MDGASGRRDPITLHLLQHNRRRIRLVPISASPSATEVVPVDLVNDPVRPVGVLETRGIDGSAASGVTDDGRGCRREGPDGVGRGGGTYAVRALGDTLGGVVCMNNLEIK